MNFSRLLFVVFSSFTFLCGTQNFGFSQENKINANLTNKIAVINLVHIRRNAAVIKNINQQIFGFQNNVKISIEKEESVLRKAKQDLTKKRAILAPEVYTEERRKFEQGVVKLQRNIQNQKQNLNKIKIKAMGKVEKILNGIITKLAKERDYLLILRTDNTVLSSRKLDITKEILTKLNNQITTLKIEPPLQ